LNYKNKAFTLIEIMASLVIFAGGLTAYMAYQTTTKQVIFSSESTAIATQLALNLGEQINSLAPDKFKAFTDGVTKGSIYYDTQLVKELNMLKNSNAGPFDARGKSLHDLNSNAPFKFFRFIKVTDYASETGEFCTINDPCFYLRNVTIYVSWPKRGHADARCITPQETDVCRIISIPLVKIAR
jgi:prepilin-type N-terminal cleavage/methylation domain-containing protein